MASSLKELERHFKRLRYLHEGGRLRRKVGRKGRRKGKEEGNLQRIRGQRRVGENVSIYTFIYINVYTYIRKHTDLNACLCFQKCNFCIALFIISIFLKFSHSLL